MPNPLAIVRDLVIIASGLSVFVLVALVGRYLGPFFRDARQDMREIVRLVAVTTSTLETLRTELGQLGETLISIRALSDTLQKSYQEQIEPTLERLEEITANLTESAQQVAAIVHEGSKFSHETIRQATYYRDRVFRPLIEAASLWTGARALLKALPAGRSKLSRRRKESNDGS